MPTTEQQSCYADEVETLREMVQPLAEHMAFLARMPRAPSIDEQIALARSRIEALRTAIEALGGEL